jgi:hypoxia up-regulated 1
VFTWCHYSSVFRFDRALGGKDFQSRLADHLAAEFTKMKKTSSDVYESPRALQKLHKEAGRVKHVLSANMNHYAQVNHHIISLMNGCDAMFV